MSLECFSRGVVEEEFSLAKVTAKDNRRPFLLSFFSNFCFIFRMKSKAPNLKINHRSPGPEVGDAWGSYTLNES